MFLFYTRNLPSKSRHIVCFCAITTTNYKLLSFSSWKRLHLFWKCSVKRHGACSEEETSLMWRTLIFDWQPEIVYDCLTIYLLFIHTLKAGLGCGITLTTGQSCCIPLYRQIPALCSNMAILGRNLVVDICIFFIQNNFLLLREHSF